MLSIAQVCVAFQAAIQLLKFIVDRSGKDSSVFASYVYQHHLITEKLLSNITIRLK